MQADFPSKQDIVGNLPHAFGQWAHVSFPLTSLVVKDCSVFIFKLAANVLAQRHDVTGSNRQACI